MNKYHFTALILGSSLAVAGSAFAGADCDKSGDGTANRAGHGRGARFSQIDGNKDGKISLVELTSSRETWLTEVDANKDGVATREEIRATFESGRQERMQKMFSRDDANKDGRLGRDETRMPSAWFEKADVDKDGALTLTELTDARKNKNAGGKHAGAAGKGHRLDVNGDGKVERQELRDAAAAQFTRLDQNKDGSLTGDEFSAGHGKRHGRHRRGADGQHDAKAAPAPVRS
jgi:Ca2+-binding EF-hand superfamily protein